MRDYELHPEAYTDLDELADYIAENNPDASQRVVDGIFNANSELVPFPYRGHRRRDLTSRPLRFLRVYDSLIAYAPDERPLWVVAVIHGSLNPRVMAAVLRSRED